jgi:hypothetical protein
MPIAMLEEKIRDAIPNISSDCWLTLIDLTGVAIAAYQVRLDSLGVPQLRVADASDLQDSSVPNEMPFFVCTAPDAAVPDSIKLLLHDWPHALIQVDPGTDVPRVLREAVDKSAIRQPYHLVTGWTAPLRGRVLLSSIELFPVGEARGATREVRVRSVCTDTTGTVLAVVAIDDGMPRLISAHSVQLGPGPLTIQAILAAPGKVVFIKPEGATADPRTWSTLIDAVPPSLNSAGPAHLVCAVDITGLASAVAARLWRVEALIKELHSRHPVPHHLKVSVVAYGAHRSQGEADDRVVVTDWMSDPETAALSLGRLGAARTSEDRAAQVEDALTEIHRRLRVTSGSLQTVLVVAGDAQPYPASNTDAIPECPNGHDWEGILSALESIGCKRAAIRDRLTGHGAGAWLRLGAGKVHAGDELNPVAFGQDVGLIVPTLNHMPFPMEETAEGSTGLPVSGMINGSAPCTVVTERPGLAIALRNGNMSNA